ncbi:MAG: isoprenylcysteine carboxylmethyltransferase family protein [Bacteroidia bacterium]|nr:isoprenylcysteine carboxylmethyltransferase family protein [Bacteroidia bacterium]
MLTFFLAWIGYYGFHSLLASTELKLRIARFSARFYRYYRLVYSISALLVLGILANFSWKVQSPILFQQKLVTACGFVLLGIGALVQVMAIRSFNLRVFMGLDSTPLPNQVSLQPLIVDGMYKYVRHPLYFGVLCMALGILFVFPYQHVLGFSLITILYLFIGSYWEEKKLIQEFGSSYVLYKSRVKGIIPFLV